MGRKRRSDTVDRMAAIVAVLEDGDGLTTTELFDTLDGAMNHSRMLAALRHLIRDGIVIRLSNDDWGQVVRFKNGTDDVFPGGGHLYFLDALAWSA